ncbi:very short patch repair endonuclease [Rhodoferax ferrireducens]|uniref:very short patch repair endonuclease n=1 Tax=Rhodoferax ferrireducens TaxID=192843 RepID=UPI003BB58FBF
MDRLTIEQRSRLMARIKSRDTKPEMAVRSTLHRLGYRYRLHVKGLPGCPDLVFPGRRKIILVHGCFWHGHSCPRGRSVPKSNVDFWTTKIQANRKRDARTLRKLRRVGWSVLTLWECVINKNLWLSKALNFLGE